LWCSVSWLQLSEFCYVNDIFKVRFESVEASKQRVIESNHEFAVYYRFKYEKFSVLVEYAKSLHRSPL